MPKLMRLVRFGTVSLHILACIHFQNLLKKLITGLPKLNLEKDRICDACQLSKQTKVSFKSKNIVSTSRPLKLLHMNLFGTH